MNCAKLLNRLSGGNKAGSCGPKKLCFGWGSRTSYGKGHLRGGRVPGTTCTKDLSNLGARRRLELGQGATNTTQQGRHAATMRPVVKLLWPLVHFYSM